MRKCPKKVKTGHVTLLLVVLVAIGADVRAELDESVIVLYADQEEYSLPIIEHTLENLTLSDGSRRFGKVINLNRMVADTVYRANLRSLVDYYMSSRYLSEGESSLEIAEETAKSLTSNDVVMRVRVTTLGSLLEFQFSLYEVSADHLDSNTLPVQDSQHPKYYGSSIIDPGTAGYVASLTNAVRRVFPECNIPPKVVLDINGKPVLSGVKHYVSRGDTVTIDASYTDDQDSPRSSLTYTWRQLDPNGGVNPPISELVRLTENAAIQHLVFAKPVLYFIGVQVGDGIGVSPIDTIAIQVIDKPILVLDKRDFTVYHQRSVFDIFKNTELVNVKLEVPGRMLTADSIDARLSVTPINSLAKQMIGKVAWIEYEDSDSARFMKKPVMKRETVYYGRGLKRHRMVLDYMSTIELVSRVEGSLPAGEYEYSLKAISRGVESEADTFSIRVSSESGLDGGVGYTYFSLVSEESDSIDGLEMYEFPVQIHLTARIALCLLAYGSTNSDDKLSFPRPTVAARLGYSFRTDEGARLLLSAQLMQLKLPSSETTYAMGVGITVASSILTVRRLGLEFYYSSFVSWGLSSEIDFFPSNSLGIRALSIR